MFNTFWSTLNSVLIGQEGRSNNTPEREGKKWRNCVTFLLSTVCYERFKNISSTKAIWQKTRTNVINNLWRAFLTAIERPQAHSWIKLRLLLTLMPLIQTSAFPLRKGRERERQGEMERERAERERARKRARKRETETENKWGDREKREGERVREKDRCCKRIRAWNRQTRRERRERMKYTERKGEREHNLAMPKTNTIQ